MNDCIEAGVPAGITIDQLEIDINRLLDQEVIDVLGLVEWCKKIESVTYELDGLAKVFERFMPHETGGQCFGLDVIGDNALLSMIFKIHDTQVQFVGEIHKINNRVLKITAGKEQLGLPI